MVLCRVLQFDCSADGVRSGSLDANLLRLIQSMLMEGGPQIDNSGTQLFFEAHKEKKKWYVQLKISIIPPAGHKKIMHDSSQG